MAFAPIEKARTLLGLTYVDIARALHVDESTVHRWRNTLERRRASAGDRRVATLTQLTDALEDRFGPDTSRSAEWLDAPNAAFGDETPRSWLLQGRADFLTGVLAGERATCAAVHAPAHAISDLLCALDAQLGSTASTDQREIVARLSVARDRLIAKVDSIPHAPREAQPVRAADALAIS